MIRLLIFLVLTIAGAGSAWPHELRPAYLELRETEPDVFSVSWKVPAIGPMRLVLDARLPANCTPRGEAVRTMDDSASFERWTAECPGGLTGQTIRIDGLDSTLTDALARISYLDGAAETVRLVPGAPAFTVAGRQSAWDVAATYLRLGVEHILLGFDHLTFVLALLLLGSGLRTVFKTITAFTVAHSITLSGAALGYLSLPQKPVEFLIAFSIVIAAAELAKAASGPPRLSQRSPWLIAFPFGLLHGLGFAGALREIGLPQTDIPLALLAFNIGVELGQLLFVAAVLLGWRLVSAAVRIPQRRASLAAAYAIGCVSATWMLMRAASLF